MKGTAPTSSSPHFSHNPPLQTADNAPQSSRTLIRASWRVLMAPRHVTKAPRGVRPVDVRRGVAGISAPSPADDGGQTWPEQWPIVPASISFPETFPLIITFIHQFRVAHRHSVQNVPRERRDGWGGLGAPVPWLRVAAPKLIPLSLIPQVPMKLFIHVFLSFKTLRQNAPRRRKHTYRFHGRCHIVVPLRLLGQPGFLHQLLAVYHFWGGCAGCVWLLVSCVSELQES